MISSSNFASSGVNKENEANRNHFKQPQYPPPVNNGASSSSSQKMPAGRLNQHQHQKENKENLPEPSKHVGKNLCASPPAILKDKKATVSFTKGKLLGEGGFARCYEVWDQGGRRFAAKAIAKASLKSPKSKQKLFTEIKIHQNMRHPHIVQFHHVFEDSQNVYMILELCENKTFVDLMKKKKRLSEAEARFYGRQLMDAISYMHKKRVIHRDLKLGNLFFNDHMDIKLGDFGLATVLSSDEERKKTICGTPNYIAPEILFDRKNGHSFEVDLWSFGVILYTILVGKPPFQTKDVQEIYKKIKDNDYQFPPAVSLSPTVKDLINSLLTTNPAMRPSIPEILSHPWFRDASPLVINPQPPAPSQFDMTPLKNALTAVGDPSKHATTKIASPVTTSDKYVSQAIVQKQAPQSVQLSPRVPTANRRSMLNTMLSNLQLGLTLQKEGADLARLIVAVADVVAPKVFISKWIDYSNKYGLGYQLTNGSVGVHFNDSTSIVLAANESNFEYLEYVKGTDKTVMNRQGHLMDKYPELLNKKVTLLKYFKSYMQENLSKASQHCFQDIEKTANLDFLVKYMRTKHAVLFRLTNNAVQINFFDHSKLILSCNGLVVTFIDREKSMTTCSLYDILLNKKSDIISRLKYTRDILDSLTNENNKR